MRPESGMTRADVQDGSVSEFPTTKHMTNVLFHQGQLITDSAISLIWPKLSVPLFSNRDQIPSDVLPTSGIVFEPLL